MAGDRLELRQLPTARLRCWFSSVAKPGLALLFLAPSQGITLPSLFWEKAAFWSAGALRKRAQLVLGRAPGCWCCRAGSALRRRRRLLHACTHMHVHSPENGEELIPEANLFCSNPVAVTGSPQVLGSGAAADHIAFMPSPGASLSHSPVAGGGEALLTVLVYLGSRARGVYGGNEQKPRGSRLQIRGMRPPPTHRLPLFNEVPLHPPPHQAPRAPTASCLSPLSGFDCRNADSQSPAREAFGRQREERPGCCCLRRQRWLCAKPPESTRPPRALLHR